MLTHDSDSAAFEAMLHRGVSAARAGLRSVAASQLERAAEDLPDDPNVWLWLAWVANSPDNTIRCLERVLELSPGHATATAGLAWARALARDPLIEPVTAPISLIVGECDASVASETQAESSTIDLAAESAEAESASETPGEPASEITTDPRMDSSEEIIPSRLSVEMSVEPVSATIPQILAESPPEDSTRRRWGDLVQRGSESLTDAAAWPSLVPPPLPSLIPPPLPSAAAIAQAEPEPLVRSRFQGMFAAHSVAPTEPTTDADLRHEAVTDVDALTKSFNPPTAADSADGRPLVMVVDDSPTVRKLVSLTLERRGFRVISAFDGVAAIKELGSCRPDLILLDINMPRLDGYRLCKLIKKHEATQSIPVVMLSGKDGMFDKLRGRLVGCSDYITKPFEADALTHKVAKYLNPASSSL